MSAGRCPGCGFEDPSCRAVRTHMNDCPEVVAMFKDPARRDQVVDPEQAYRDYRAWLKSPEGEAFVQAARDDRDAAYREYFEAKISRERERFSRPAERVDSG